DSEAASGFLIVWLTFWTVAGLFALRVLLWMVWGKEVITFERGQMTIHKRGSLLTKPKIYDLKEMKNIRVSEQGSAFPMWPYNGTNFLTPGTNGTIKFDYGLKAIKIADGLDEVEARFILDKLREKRI